MNDGEGPPAEPAAEGEGRRGGHRARARTRQGDQRRPNRWRSRTKDQSERSHGRAVDDWAPTPRAKKTARAPQRSQPPTAGAKRGAPSRAPPKERAVKATTAPNSFIWWRSVQSPWRLHQMLCLVQLSALLRQRSHPAGPGAGRRSPSRKRPAEWGGGCRASERRPSEQCDSEQCEERRDRASKPRTAGGTKDNS